MAAAKLSEKEIAAEMKKLSGWSVVKGNLHRKFEFKDFTQAFGFMKRVALAADRMSHHPDWSNAYNKVSIDLSTHSAGGITENDFELASKIQKIHGHQSAWLFASGHRQLEIKNLQFLLTSFIVLP